MGFPPDTSYDQDRCAKCKTSHPRSLLGIWSRTWGRNQSPEGHPPHTPQKLWKVDTRNPAPAMAQNVSRMNLLAPAAVTLSHLTHKPWGFLKKKSLALQLIAFLHALATNSSAALGTGILTLPVLHADTPSSMLSPLFAWHSPCGVQKELEEKDCHLKRRQAGHCDVHITALDSIFITPAISNTGHTHHLAVFAKCNKNSQLLSVLPVSTALPNYTLVLLLPLASLFLKGWALFVSLALLIQPSVLLWGSKRATLVLTQTQTSQPATAANTLPMQTLKPQLYTQVHSLSQLFFLLCVLYHASVIISAWIRTSTEVSG